MTSVNGVGIFTSDPITLINAMVANRLNGGDCIGKANASSSNDLIENNLSVCGLTTGTNRVWDKSTLAFLGTSSRFFQNNKGYCIEPHNIYDPMKDAARE